MYPSSHGDVKSGPILGHVTKSDEGSLAIGWEMKTKRNLSSIGSCLFVVVVGLDNKEKLDSRLQSGRLLGKEQVREKCRMKGSVQSFKDVCVRVNISIQEMGLHGGREGV